MRQLLLVLLGGGVGSACRYGIGLGMARLLGIAFPWGTLCVNSAGSFLIGVLFELGQKGILKPDARLLLITGFLGGLTTFSSLALETTNFARSQAGALSVVNLFANNAIGLGLVIAGMRAARALT